MPRKYYYTDAVIIPQQNNIKLDCYYNNQSIMAINKQFAVCSITHNMLQLQAEKGESCNVFQKMSQFLLLEAHLNQ